LVFEESPIEQVHSWSRFDKILPKCELDANADVVASSQGDLPEPDMKYRLHITPTLDIHLVPIETVYMSWRL
jgi:hypothetical protein